MKHAFSLFLSFLFLAHCTPKEEVEISTADKDMLAALRATQIKTGLSDEELVKAVARYCEIYQVMEEGFNDGLFSIEDWKHVPNQLKELETAQLQSDSMAAAVCLGALKADQDDSTAEFNVHLRKILARYYDDIRELDDESYVDFRKRVEDYATRDDELAKLIKNQS